VEGRQEKDRRRFIYPVFRLVLECSNMLSYQIFGKDVKIKEDSKKRGKKCKVEKIVFTLTPGTQTAKLTYRDIKNSLTHNI